MKTVAFLSSLFLATSLFAQTDDVSAPAPLPADADADAVRENELAIHPATEIVFPTETGLTYRLEVSTDLTEWEVIESITGNGNQISRIFPAREEERTTYRVIILE